ncbi:MAG: hypothetical protein HXL17_05125 [Peptostreptococcus sp.]|mgnify:FL=1|jgi:hypothetical protein|uniref:hypothetical protein n=1 Tax=Peptostreptococcus sp. TaxID=1262 RepID=UPI001CB1A3C7|nr:hypothetical protein [Peptostreptococcus sp.]MBF1043804.1 hypothetical protein [Peptostreptococcus sp.]MBF1045753.1 hypothetical protein [Peptostreptococcus sp.]MBF1057465.1 hypothetical protein [Peptostreptococcus sp.]
MLGDIIRYNFFALDDVDYETYSLDYAVILDIDEDKNTVKILPISNKFSKDSIESFCIGLIPGFVEIKNEGYVSNKQYVHFSKVIDVRPEELHPVHVQDISGSILKSENDKAISVALTDDQLERVLRKYKIYEIGEERNLINLLMKSDAQFVLADSNEIDQIRNVCNKEMDKYREYNFKDKKVVVFFVEGKRYSVVMVPTDNKDLAYRNDSLKAALAN